MICVLSSSCKKKKRKSEKTKTVKRHCELKTFFFSGSHNNLTHAHSQTVIEIVQDELEFKSVHITSYERCSASVSPACIRLVNPVFFFLSPPRYVKPLQPPSLGLKSFVCSSGKRPGCQQAHGSGSLRLPAALASHPFFFSLPLSSPSSPSTPTGAGMPLLIFLTWREDGNPSTRRCD